MKKAPTNRAASNGTPTAADKNALAAQIKAMDAGIANPGEDTRRTNIERAGLIAWQVATKAWLAELVASVEAVQKLNPYGASPARLDELYRALEQAEYAADKCVSDTSDFHSPRAMLDALDGDESPAGQV